MVTQSQIQNLSSDIIETINPDRIYLFGSYAVGNATEKSDVDILIVVDNNDVSRHKRLQPLWKKIFGKYNFTKDIIIYTKDEIEKWKHVNQAFITTILKQSKLIYERK